MSEKKSSTTSDSMEQTKRQHELYFNAVSNPLRRKILKSLKKGDATIEELALRTALEKDTLKWHLDILKHGSCVEEHVTQGKLFYKLTKEGSVIDCME